MRSGARHGSHQSAALGTDSEYCQVLWLGDLYYLSLVLQIVYVSKPTRYQGILHLIGVVDTP